MINTRLQIPYDPASTATVFDAFKEYGLLYLDAEERLAPPTKGFEKTTYAEEEGEHIDPKTVDDAFDYKAKFLVQAKNSDLENANIIIRDFNRRLYTQEGDVKTFHQIAFYNDYNRVKIVGYPQPITEATDFWRDKHGNVADAVQVEWTIRVTKPSLCDFALTNVKP